MLGILIAILACMAAPVGAADIKIGVIDLQQALNVSDAGQAARAKIAGKAGDYQKTIQGRQDELKKLQAGFEKQKMLLSKDSIADKERDYQQKVKEFQRFAKDAQEELQQEDAQATRQILEEVRKIVEKIGSQGGYAVILERSSVLFRAENIDLTEQVVKAYNASYKKGGGK